jgi:hypothetical protein
MNIFTKEIDQITESDLKELENKPNNYESHRLEFKLFFDINNSTHKNEIMRDIIAFANSSSDALLFYGISDTHEIIGMNTTRNLNGDTFQNFLVNKIKSSIEPNLLPFIKLQPLTLANGKFIFIIKITSVYNEIFGIKQKLSIETYGKKTFAYEFWIRASGNKVEMKLTDVIEQIKRKSFPRLDLNFPSGKKTYSITARILRRIKNNTKQCQFFRLVVGVKNLGDHAATNINLTLKFKTRSGVIIYNTKDYLTKHSRKKYDKKPMLTAQKQLKREVKHNQPFVKSKTEGGTINWTLSFNIENIRGGDLYNTPNIYINIPKSNPEEVIQITGEFRLDQPSDQVKQTLKLEIGYK